MPNTSKTTEYDNSHDQENYPLGQTPQSLREQGKGKTSCCKKKALSVGISTSWYHVSWHAVLLFVWVQQDKLTFGRGCWLRGRKRARFRGWGRGGIFCNEANSRAELATMSGLRPWRIFRKEPPVSKHSAPRTLLLRSELRGTCVGCPRGAHVRWLVAEQVLKNLGKPLPGPISWCTGLVLDLRSAGQYI